MEGEQKWCVVTGGRGFAARHLVEMLIRSGRFSVRIADLGPSIKLEPSEEKGLLGEALQSGRAEYVSADLRDKAQVLKACQGAEAVFHMAAPDSSINNHQLHHSVNVQGTKNVIDACIEQKVKRLIYTSSPSVVFDGVHRIFNGEESLPYPDKHNDSYSATKAEGEASVIKSNGTNGLLTCCIRPSSIFGPGDKLLVPSLVNAARAGKSKASMFSIPVNHHFGIFFMCMLSSVNSNIYFCSTLTMQFIIGDGNNMYDFTYVENVAHAHICAEQALASEGKIAEQAAGQAYFITNMEPIKFWEFVSLILEGLGYERYFFLPMRALLLSSFILGDECCFCRPRIKIPALVMMPIAHMVEWTYKMLAPYGMKVPQLTPSRIRLLSCSRTFSCSKAKDQLSYTPIVSLQEGLRRTIDSYPDLRAEHLPKREGPSKASRYLGSGRVADTLLWKDKKLALTTLLVLMAFYHNFIASGYTIVTAVSKLFLVASIFLFIHGNLPEKILGYTVEKIPPSNFHFSEERSHRAALSVASSWNTAVNVLKSLCKGDDWMLFLKVVLSLLILSFLGAISLQSLFVTGLLIAFVAFYIYENKEEEIDRLASEALSFSCKLKSDIAKKLPTFKKFSPSR
ncbi:3beta-hydroxysteroid-dehydrogenase/decarboxylase isoform 2 [Vitis vinifera]|uniref:Reticulon-like protein n=1 Tax=Vitis vinifera TaxID=29760 RepID=A0A438EX05_VITVI|nr:3beta-hydroxysteroid-dehydrogenase/decarboxylase isoform 2 [Vitis vinifera]